MAVVECVRQGDTETLAVVLRHGNACELAVMLAKLLAELLDEQEVPAQWFREWALAAARR